MVRKSGPSRILISLSSLFMNSVPVHDFDGTAIIWFPSASWITPRGPNPSICWRDPGVPTPVHVHSLLQRLINILFRFPVLFPDPPSFPYFSFVRVCLLICRHLLWTTTASTRIYRQFVYQLLSDRGSDDNKRPVSGGAYFGTYCHSSLVVLTGVGTCTM